MEGALWKEKMVAGIKLKPAKRLLGNVRLHNTGVHDDIKWGNLILITYKTTH